MKALLVVNPFKPESQTIAAEIKSCLSAKRIETRSVSYTDGPDAFFDCDIAFSLGGDGTVLFTARTVAEKGIPILPVNLGTLGFISSVHPAEWENVFEEWRAGRGTVSERLMLLVTLERGGKLIFKSHAMNDAVVSASGIAKTIRLSGATDEFPFADYRSDGLIAATPTGSTAYCASAGGPIVDPEVEAIILNPICPFSLFRKPLVMPASRTAVITIEREQRSGVLLTIDGQVTEEAESGDMVRISRAPLKAAFLASDRRTFYRALHSKLGT